MPRRSVRKNHARSFFPTSQPLDYARDLRFRFNIATAPSNNIVAEAGMPRRSARKNHTRSLFPAF